MRKRKLKYHRMMSRTTPAISLRKSRGKSHKWPSPAFPPKWARVTKRQLGMRTMWLQAYLKRRWRKHGY